MRLLVRLFVRVLLSAVVLWGVANLSLLRVDSFPAALSAALVLAFVNATVKPVVRLLTLPLRLLTLGLFSFVLNAGFLYLVEQFVRGFHTVGFLSTVIAAVLISVATSVVTWVARV